MIIQEIKRSPSPLTSIRIHSRLNIINIDAIAITFAVSDIKQRWVIAFFM